jgi:hypothetical protein
MFRALIVITAVIVALVPYPAAIVERWYSRGLYPRLQPLLTQASNAVPVAIIDIVFALLITWLLVSVLRRWRKRGAVAAFVRFLTWGITATAVLYLLFFVSWGLNYRRVPLEQKLAFSRERISEEAAMRLAATAIERVNAGHAAAHARGFDTQPVLASLDDVHRHLGAPLGIVPANTKPSLLEHYFRYAAIDGMTVPVALEVILNPDLLPVELPFTWAHEQAHIAGYADESEANFVAWLACVRSSDPLAQYSAWLDAYRIAANALPRARRGDLPRLADGPREDLRAIAARLDRSSPLVRNAARNAYDSYLRANRIEEGIANYGVVLQLILGVEFTDGYSVRLRRSPQPLVPSP